MSRPGHYSPEEIYERVKPDLPSISLATVYKNLKTFVQAGMLRDVSPSPRPLARGCQQRSSSSFDLHALPFNY